MSEKYFKNLNYTMSNEDTEFEYQLLERNTEHVLSICGSGSRVLPLFAKMPKKMSLVDYSSEQLALTQMRILAVKELEYTEFLEFMGYKDGMSQKIRKETFHKFHLTPEAKSYLEEFFKFNNWMAPLYQGNYERALKKIASIIRPIFGSHIERMQKIDNHEEFSNYIKNEFPHMRWKMILFFLGNSTFLNAILYKGNHPVKNISESYSEYYTKLFQELFKFLTPKESFFLQMIFFGEIKYMDGAPFEADETIFQQMKEGISQCEIKYYQGELISIINEKIKSPINFISFSDILSYFKEDIETEYLQKIKHQVAKGALTVHRYYLRINYGLKTNGYLTKTDQFKDLILKEKTQIYEIDIYQRD